MHKTVIRYAIKHTLPLRRDHLGYYHVIRGDIHITSMRTTAQSGLAALRKFRRAIA